MKNLANEQMELSLSGARRARRRARREDRLTRAAWWFNKMRAAVNNAMDWETASQPRPEQTWLPGSQRQVRI
jgi:hypothetical protein